MGLFSWLFGGSAKVDHMGTGKGIHQMQPATMPNPGVGAGSGMHMQHSGPASAMRMNMAKDPVCGMDVNPEKAAAQFAYQGNTYYFCAPGCKQSFEQNPTKFIAGAGQTKQDMHAGGHQGGCCG